MLKAVALRKKILVSAAAFMAIALLAAAILSLSALTPVKAASEDQPTKRTVNVSGEGTVNASPDIAYVTMGVLTENKDAKTAQQNNAAAMDKVVALLKSSGIKSEDIKTVNYTISPKYDYIQSTGESRITGYSVNNSVQVTVKDITKVGSLIDLAAGSGVNLTSNISFGLSDYEKFYNDALKKALEAAKKKADTIAGVYGITLSLPVTISESGGYSPVYSFGGYAVKADMAAPATPIQPGNMEIKANVNVVYEY